MLGVIQCGLKEIDGVRLSPTDSELGWSSHEVSKGQQHLGPHG